MEKDFGWDCEAEILALHQQGPGNTLASRVIALGEAGDAIARDLLCDAANTCDPRAQRRARGALDILQSEGALPGGKIVDNARLGRTHAAADDAALDKSWFSRVVARAGHNGL
jgi:hypothetical protein